jgi:hypothetical protein
MSRLIVSGWLDRVPRPKSYPDRKTPGPDTFAPGFYLTGVIEVAVSQEQLAPPSLSRKSRLFPISLLHDKL